MAPSGPGGRVTVGLKMIYAAADADLLFQSPPVGTFLTDVVTAPARSLTQANTWPPASPRGSSLSGKRAPQVERDPGGFEASIFPEAWAGGRIQVRQDGRDGGEGGAHWT